MERKERGERGEVKSTVAAGPPGRGHRPDPDLRARARDAA